MYKFLNCHRQITVKSLCFLEKPGDSVEASSQGRDRFPKFVFDKSQETPKEKAEKKFNSELKRIQEELQKEYETKHLADKKEDDPAVPAFLDLAKDKINHIRLSKEETKLLPDKGPNMGGPFYGGDTFNIDMFHLKDAVIFIGAIPFPSKGEIVPHTTVLPLS